MSPEHRAVNHLFFFFNSLFIPLNLNTCRFLEGEGGKIKFLFNRYVKSSKIYAALGK